MTEDFLTRWSRRKQQATQETAQQAKAAAAAPVAQQDPLRDDEKIDDGVSDDAVSREDVFDPATLPPIDSITALTDIRDFLRTGVPAELSRAALRRAWSADPAIRDFVGLAENAWDFTDPNAMPGFGPLESTEEIRQLVERIVGKIGEAADITNSRADDNPSNSADISTKDVSRPEASQEPSSIADSSAPTLIMPAATASATSVGDRNDDVAMQQPAAADASLRPRARGRALPK